MKQIKSNEEAKKVFDLFLSRLMRKHGIDPNFTPRPAYFSIKRAVNDIGRTTFNLEICHLSKWN